MGASVLQLLCKRSAELGVAQASWLRAGLPADWGRVGEGASLNQPQCNASTYGGDTFVQGESYAPSRASFTQFLCAAGM